MALAELSRLEESAAAGMARLAGREPVFYMSAMVKCSLFKSVARSASGG